MEEIDRQIGGSRVSSASYPQPPRKVGSGRWADEEREEVEVNELLSSAARQIRGQLQSEDGGIDGPAKQARALQRSPADAGELLAFA